MKGRKPPKPARLPGKAIKDPSELVMPGFDLDGDELVAMRERPTENGQGAILGRSCSFYTFKFDFIPG